MCGRFPTRMQSDSQGPVAFRSRARQQLRSRLMPTARAYGTTTRWLMSIPGTAGTPAARLRAQRRPCPELSRTEKGECYVLAMIFQSAPVGRRKSH